MERNSVGGTIFDLCNAIFLLALSFITLYPIIYVIAASVSDPAQLMAHQGMLFKPYGFTLAAYRMVLENPMIAKGYLNTFFIVVIGVAFNIILTSFGAYAFSRKSLRYRRQYMLFMVFTMFFSGGLIPIYLIVKGIGLYNSLFALILPQAINTFNLIIMKTSFDAIPDALEESAKVDGANDFVILFRIILPVSMPVVAVMLLFYGVAHWNSWFQAMIFLRDRSLFPLQLILREILIQGNTDSMSSNSDAGSVALLEATIKYATIMVATLPILLVYPFLQKYFVKGALLGAIKG